MKLIPGITKPAEPAVDVNSVSRIAEGTAVTGEFVSRTDVRIDGSVKGKIYSDGRIVVGEGATVDGTVFCSDLDLWGKVEGEVFVRNLLSIKSGADVSGNLHVRRLQVEIGATVNGSCKMISEEDFDKYSSESVKVE